MDDSLKTREEELREEERTLKENSKRVNVLVFLLLTLLIIAALLYLFAFTIGQIQATHAITEVAQAVKELMESGESASDYVSIISDMQATQQAYSQSASTNMLSVVYAVVTAVILGYGVKMIRHNDEDRQKIQLTEKKLSESVKLMEAKTKSSFIEHNNAYIVTTFCRNAAYTCTLLQSHIALQLQNNGTTDSKSRRIIESLQVDLMKSLEHFLAFLEANKQGLTPETLEALQYSWRLAKDSLRAYIKADDPNEVALVVEFFPDTADALQNLCNKIDECFKKR